MSDIHTKRSNEATADSADSEDAEGKLVEKSYSYASALQQNVYLGVCGLPEQLDSFALLSLNVSKVAALMTQTSRVVAFTGAGISTASGIADFRGPQGVWTIRQQTTKKTPRNTNNNSSLDFAAAVPSFTHVALHRLIEEKRVQLIVSQNVDGLHGKSGVLPDNLAEIHGNVFIEQCDTCGNRIRRDYEIQSVGYQYTGRTCMLNGCNGKLHDIACDWDTPLPHSEKSKAEDALKNADICLILGTSLRIRPAMYLPLRCKRLNGKAKSGKLICVNLQDTPLDKYMDIRIYGRTDDFMRLLLKKLNIPIEYNIDELKMIEKNRIKIPLPPLDCEIEKRYKAYQKQKFLKEQLKKEKQKQNEEEKDDKKLLKKRKWEIVNIHNAPINNRPKRQCQQKKEEMEKQKKQKKEQLKLKKLMKLEKLEREDLTIKKEEQKDENEMKTEKQDDNDKEEEKEDEDEEEDEDENEEEYVRGDNDDEEEEMEIQRNDVIKDEDWAPGM